MYNSEISDHLLKILEKIRKKDKLYYEKILKKIEDILQSDSLDRFKNLRYSLKDSKRVHIGHFVIVFQYNKKTNTIKFDDFEHHDKVYKK